MWQRQPNNSSSYGESLKALQADIEHANTLAASIPGDYGEDGVQMRLSYSPFAPLLLFLFEWMDYTCTDSLPASLGIFDILVYKAYVDGTPTLSSKERKVSLREFYAVIYPLLMQLEVQFVELEDKHKGESSRKKFGERTNTSDINIEKDDECGICMENSPGMALPNCCHSLCISCFRDWNERSQSCPFCRGSLRRVSSRDLWVLISNSETVDSVTLADENLWRFYRYIENLPLVMPETHSAVFLIDYMI